MVNHESISEPGASCRRLESARLAAARQVWPLTLTAAFGFIFMASPAWAVQAHGGAEGLVMHQIGHVLFTVGMGYLLCRLYSLHLKGTGWFEFKTFLWLLVLWNALTFSGHWMNEYVASDHFTTIHSHTQFFTADCVFDGFYYLTRLDHIVLVPAFIFLLLALRKWRTVP